MLITLQSDNDSNANDFTNYLKENIMIEPKSEIGLINCSYNFESSITVSAGVNDTYKITFGSGTNDSVTATITAGSYQPADFLTEIELSLKTAIESMPYRVQKAFPHGSQNWTMSNGILSLLLTYSASEWDRFTIQQDATQTRREIILANPNMMNNGTFASGVLDMKEITNGKNTITWESGDPTSGVLSCIWGTSSIETSPHGSYVFYPQQVESEIYVCLNQNAKPALIEDSVIQVRLLLNGNLEIFEENSVGTPQQIYSGTYEAWNKIEIRVEQVVPEDGRPDPAIRYFVDSTEITVNPGVDRWLPRNTTKLICCGSFVTPAINSQLCDTAVVADCLDQDVFTVKTAGTGYIQGENVLIEKTDGTGIAIAKIGTLADPATGSLNKASFLNFQDHLGGVTVNEDLNVISKLNGQNCVIESGIGSDSHSVTDHGAGYANGAADVFDNTGTINLGTCNITVNGGLITTVTFTDRLPNKNIDYNTVVQIHQGANVGAKVTFKAVTNFTPSLSGVYYDVTDSTAVDEPLMAHKNYTFTPTVGFTNLTSITSSSGSADPPVTLTGTSAIADGKETDQMLVNVEQFQIKSVCKLGGIQKAVGSLPYGQREQPAGTSAQSGYFFEEPYNLIYHDLSNSTVENHNQLRCRLTDAVGNPLLQLKHPTTVTLDLRPRAK